ncbi:MAG: gamma-glutamyl-gamma-aminobutyrate hydrolase family protein, partial [Paraclostridium sp.]
IKTLGSNLKVIAYSNDGVIEAVQKENEKFVLGVQWHPELMVDYSSHMLNLFKRFIDECR